MSQKSEIEARGQNVEQAIQAGLVKLGLDRHEVSIKIIDEGSRGLLGIGSRNAVVKLTSLVVKEPPPPVRVEPVKVDPVPEPEPEPEPVVVETAVSTPLPPAPTAAESESDSDEEPEIDLEAEKGMALDVLQTLLDKMHVEAELAASLSEEDDVTGRQINIIEINGNDLGILIGPRGETLGSMQYLTRLMVGHKLRRRVDFVIDIEKYRQRREQALTRLAERMAKKVIIRGRPVGLEPMPPNERRVIHMALRNHDEVYTESSGEGKRRKVRILPK
ncbi:MAG: KH domain-containing protein [Chloroflexi bacterium]|nr:KH domain-containing protein [Chloroflexota bacterium]